jgi:hypothetical protein
MVEPTTVWLVHLDARAADDIEGTLSEDETGLVFTEEASGSVTRFAFSEMTKVKRVMASPVFIVRYKPESRETAFYLSPPPPLGVLGGQDPAGAALQTTRRFGGSGKWRQRRENSRYLAATSTHVRDLRDAWVDRIRTAMKEQRNR